MSKNNKNYTNEFKEESIKLALSSTSICEAARSLGIPKGTLHTWVRNAKKSGQCYVSTEAGVINNVNVNKLIEENKQLHKQLARLEQEKAILKKAATYFAKELG